MIDDRFKRPAEVDLLVGDYSKAEHELGWKPQITFDEGLPATVNWYVENRSWWQPKVESLGELDEAAWQRT